MPAYNYIVQVRSHQRALTHLNNQILVLENQVKAIEARVDMGRIRSLKERIQKLMTSKIVSAN